MFISFPHFLFFFFKSFPELSIFSCLFLHKYLPPNVYQIQGQQLEIQLMRHMSCPEGIHSPVAGHQASASTCHGGRSPGLFWR